jgi:hypothetical protein
MDALTFISEIVKATVWPASFWAAIYVLRKPLSELVPLLIKVRYKDIELEFASELRTLTEDYELPVEVELDRQAIDATRRINGFLLYSPVGAVGEAWLEVEHAAVAALLARHVNTPEYSKNARRLGRWLLEEKIISREEADFYNKLKNLRNLSIHAGAPKVSIEDANEYVALAIKLSARIRSKI